MPTRRTHIVRIGASDTPPGQDPSTYVDVEVLDAISFRTTQGKEMILDFAGGTIIPYIVDDTGDGNAKKPSAATRRSHMQRVASDDGLNFVDVEVLDCIAFRGENGQEWILNLPADGDPDANNPESAANEYNTTTHTGPRNATRRVHNEKISTDLTTKKSANDDYFTVTRTDMVAFRTINGQEVIINMASNDDPLSSDKRADTHTTPTGYDPTDKSTNAVKPPLLASTSDKNLYVYIPKNSGTITALKDKRIAQGPLWWIRNVSGGRAYLIVTMTGEADAAGGTPAPPTFSVTSEDNIPLIEAGEPQTDSHFLPGVPETQKFFFIWYAGAAFPDETTVGTRIGLGIPYGGQFSLVLNINSGGFGASRTPGANADGFYTSMDAAVAGAAFQNNVVAERVGETIEWFSSVDGAPTQGPAGFSSFFAAEVDIVTPGVGIGSASSTQQFLFGPMPEGTSANFSAQSFGATRISGADAELEINVSGNVTSFDTMGGGQTAAGDNASATNGSFSIFVFTDSTNGGVNSVVDVEGDGGGGGPSV